MAHKASTSSYTIDSVNNINRLSTIAFKMALDPPSGKGTAKTKKSQTAASQHQKRRSKAHSSKGVSSVTDDLPHHNRRSPRNHDDASTPNSTHSASASSPRRSSAKRSNKEVTQSPAHRKARSSLPTPKVLDPSRTSTDKEAKERGGKKKNRFDSLTDADLDMDSDSLDISEVDENFFNTDVNSMDRDDETTLDGEDEASDGEDRNEDGEDEDEDGEDEDEDGEDEEDNRQLRQSGFHVPRQSREVNWDGSCSEGGKSCDDEPLINLSSTRK